MTRNSDFTGCKQSSQMASDGIGWYWMALDGIRWDWIGWGQMGLDQKMNNNFTYCFEILIHKMLTHMPLTYENRIFVS